MNTYTDYVANEEIQHQSEHQEHKSIKLKIKTQQLFTESGMVLYSDEPLKGYFIQFNAPRTYFEEEDNH